jgi:hypothetical protein
LICAEAFPNRIVSKNLSLDVSKRLICSLSEIITYYKDLFPNEEHDKIINNLKNIGNSSSFFWFYSAINRRLCDFVLNDAPNKVGTYIKILSSAKFNDFHDNQMINLCNLNRFERTLFDYFASEGVPEKNIYYSPNNKTILHTTSLIKEANDILKSDMNEIYEEIKNCINTYIIFSSNTISSGTSSNLLKCIYVQTFKEKNTITLIRMLDRLVHETAHMYLHLLSIYDPFLLNSIEEKYPSPFRKDPRPLIGIFHAHFVIFRLINVLQNSSIRSTFKTSLNELDDMLFRYKKAFLETKIILNKYARFTSLGQKLFDEMIIP